MPEETLNEAIQKTNFHSLFKQLMTDAKKDKYREFNFIVEDPQDRWIIQVRRKYQNLFEQGLDMLNLTTKAYTYTCLLYTSPSPRDATLSRMPSSA